VTIDSDSGTTWWKKICYQTRGRLERILVILSVEAALDSVSFKANFILVNPERFARGYA
jgi:hypothetical protein